MTATPIPRTLTMTLYGDLDVSVIDELPADRKPVVTAVRSEQALPGIYEFLRREIQNGRQAYIVYPLVEESEKLDLKSAVDHYQKLRDEIFPDLNVGLLHGQMFWYEKDEIMRTFLNREIDILVSTTVIEVGIDVPNASVMVVENAERFGLSQLHQLRGRVGRGNDQSYCILVATRELSRLVNRHRSEGKTIDLSSVAGRRLDAMVETNDGFRISEIDLELRGPGDVTGTQQSGLPDFVFADIIADRQLLEEARHAAFELISDDPDLERAEHDRVAAMFQKYKAERLRFAEIG